MKIIKYILRSILRAENKTFRYILFNILRDKNTSTLIIIARDIIYRNY